MNAIVGALLMTSLIGAGAAPAANAATEVTVAEAALGKPVRLAVWTLTRDGPWVFVMATMQDVHGQPFDFRGSARAAAAEQGFVSRSFAALLHGGKGEWRVVENAVGPTDVAWSGWAAEHGVPAGVVP